MSKQLWLLRHGDAEPHGTRPDPERALTERGEQQSRDAGAAFVKLGLEFASVWTSPKVRARDTAVLACRAFGASPIEHEPLYAGFSATDALEVMASVGVEEKVLVVGHEPDLSQVVHDLTGARVDLKKGGVAAVRLEGSRGELLVLLRPRELSAMAG